MFNAQALRSFANTLTVNVKGLTAEAAKNALVRTAEVERDRVTAQHTARSGIAPLYRQIVDGIEGAPFVAVRPDGVIVLAWQLLREVVADTHGALVNRSPRLTGAYIAGLLILVDGVVGTIADITIDTKQVVIVATVVYSRRLEVGKKKSGAPFVVQVAPHIVRETAEVAKSLYGNVAAIEFLMVDAAEVPGLQAYTLKLAESRRPRRLINGVWRRQRAERRLHGKIETQVRYPAISIRPRVA
jgi:hypothetical protein